MPTDALPNQAGFSSALVRTAARGARICRGIPTSGLVNRHNGSPKRRIGLVEVVDEGGEGKARGNDARVTERRCQHSALFNSKGFRHTIRRGTLLCPERWRPRRSWSAMVFLAPWWRLEAEMQDNAMEPRDAGQKTLDTPRGSGQRCISYLLPRIPAATLPGLGANCRRRIQRLTRAKAN
jgi:hypothetical protein